MGWDEFITIGYWNKKYGGFWEYPNCEMDDYIDFKYWADIPVVPGVVQ